MLMIFTRRVCLILHHLSALFARASYQRARPAPDSNLSSLRALEWLTQQQGIKRSSASIDFVAEARRTELRLQIGTREEARKGASGIR